MTWPTFGDVLPILTVIWALLAAAVAWARLSDRTVSRAVERAGLESEAAARAAADRVSAEVKALADKLSTNDLPHIEAKIDSVEATARADRTAVEARLGHRLGRAGQDRRDMEARLLDAIRVAFRGVSERPKDPSADERIPQWACARLPLWMPTSHSNQ